MARPNFFIAGAPKCGTSSLHDYLGQHPDVFMSKLKEPIRFGMDLEVRSIWCIRDEQKYEALFDNGKSARRRGESTTWYLYSQTAADEIKAYDPDARIIAMLRNPVDAMYSLHGQFLFAGHETIADFRDALAAEPQRRDGHNIPPTTGIPKTLLYSQIFLYTDQIERYFDRFGRENVKVIFFDEFTRRTPEVYREVLEFLGVDPSFQADLKVVNPAKKVSLPLTQFFAKRNWLRRSLHAIVPKSTHKRIYQALARVTGTLERPEKIPPDLRQELLPRFATEIDRLEALLGRDLSHWRR